MICFCCSSVVCFCIRSIICFYCGVGYICCVVSFKSVRVCCLYSTIIICVVSSNRITVYSVYLYRAIIRISDIIYTCSLMTSVFKTSSVS